jgi:nitroreductase
VKDWGLLEALYSQRSIRDYTDEPVTDEELHFLLDTAVKAPSGGNRQPWAFVVIRKQETKHTLGQLFLRSFEAYTERVRGMAEKGIPEAQRQVERWTNNTNFGAFQKNFEKAPVMILVCADERVSSGVHPGPQAAVMSMNSLYGSIFPAVQNILLGCMSLGLGAVPTTLHSYYENEVKELIGIPEHFRTVCLLPIGHTEKRYGPTRRIPAHEKTHWDRWNDQRQWEPRTRA